ncbi:hypothetical protein DSO57_1009231 [Entomophthora muscae]|uniref:Uncharacterized protein n=1 Tax=Entomophthora muscae TaxID=34485 RepID=A0ACC2THR5_9FUNG|nr:hypothetical protein DSO57_1009231 [Entomophthora muscae]
MGGGGQLTVQGNLGPDSCLQKCSDLHELVNSVGIKEAKDVFNCFTALALVIKEETNAFCDALLRHLYIIANHTAFAPCIEYFETQWVGVFQGVRHIRKGSDSITWNCFKQGISSRLFKTGMKTKGDPPKQTKAVKKYTEISKAVLAYYPKDRKLEHLQAISVAFSTNV